MNIRKDELKIVFKFNPLHSVTNICAFYHSIVWLCCCALYFVPDAYIIRNKLKLKYVNNIIATDNLNWKIMLIQLRDLHSYFLLNGMAIITLYLHSIVFQFELLFVTIIATSLHLSSPVFCSGSCWGVRGDSTFNDSLTSKLSCPFLLFILLYLSIKMYVSLLLRFFW
jgi:hypothetical protein